jgi:hypothetical protein
MKASDILYIVRAAASDATMTAPEGLRYINPDSFNFYLQQAIESALNIEQREEARGERCCYDCG